MQHLWPTVLRPHREDPEGLSSICASGFRVLLAAVCEQSSLFLLLDRFLGALDRQVKFLGSI